MISSLAYLRLQYDDGIERSPEMMALLVSRRVYVETEWRNTGKLQKVTEKDNVDTAEFDVVLGGFRGAELVVKLDHELAIHHADLVNEEVSTIGPFAHFFPAHLVRSVAALDWYAQGAV